MTVRTGILPPRYHSVTPIGGGGMGVVYRALDTSLGRNVAVKVLDDRHSFDPALRARFKREALAAARLSGEPHVVTIFDVGQWSDRPYIVMENLEGGSLQDRMRRGRIDRRQALVWLGQTAAALDAAHKAGIVHRDVKPANLLLDSDDSVRVADFGIASAAGTDSLTMTGTVLGTAGYLSPEQARGEKAGPAGDLYALAVVAYELLTGSKPFDEPYSDHSAVPSVVSRDPALPVALDDVFARALSVDPARRPATATELVAELRRAFAGETTATHVAEPATVALPPPVARRRRRTPLVLIGLLASGVAGAALAAALIGGGDDNAARNAPPPSVRVRTVTAPGTTIERTVSAPATTHAAAPPPPPPPPAAADGHDLNDSGYAKLQAGDAAGALPLLQQAVQALQGTGPDDPYEGYANYNLGIALLDLGQCSDAKQYLEAARHLEPHRHEPKDALKQADKCIKAQKGKP